MQSKLKSSIAVLLIAATTSLAGATVASAGNFGFELHFGGHHSSPQFRYYNTQPRYHKYKHHSRKRCRPRKALKKARHKYGVRHSEITRVNKRKVVVRGYNYGHPVKLVFANRKGCPLIAYR
ncbi:MULTISPECIES: hypothetical protein [unclassified Lentilitoribacter]|uniref:hypothetical protein n=1 Tax=unclassified Lentilitoribacter TaxID=2647570 RepID=UPI0013A6EBD3|nr:hypothetical protein [Lentilitoribacter sp. Alg239-R112]